MEVSCSESLGQSRSLTGQKRFNETIKGLEDDVKMKEDAKQALVDEIDEAAAAKRGPVPIELPGRTSDPDEEGDMYMDDGTATGTGTPAFTPGVTPAPGKDSGVNTDVEMEDDDDLFGDATADEADSVGTPTAGGDQTDAEGDAEGEDDEDEDEEGDDQLPVGNLEPEVEDDDELAMMLAEEMGTFGSFENDNMASTSPAAAPDEQAQADATAALDNLAEQDMLEGAVAGMQMGSQNMGGNNEFMGWAGGVGMRRRAEGVADDGSGSSDEYDSDE